MDDRDDGTRYHKGVDIVASQGSVVVSPVDGRVVKIRRNHRTAGHIIVIADNAGYTYHMFHLARFASNIEVGSTVHAGQLVAFVGDTGTAEPHVHFELHRNGIPVNPRHSLDAARYGDLRCAPADEVTDEWLDRDGSVVSPERDRFRADDESLCVPPPVVIVIPERPTRERIW